MNQGNVVFNNLCTSDHSIFVLKTHTCSTLGSTTESGTSLELPLSRYSDGDSDDDCFILEYSKSDKEQGQGYTESILKYSR